MVTQNLVTLGDTVSKKKKTKRKKTMIRVTREGQELGMVPCPQSLKGVSNPAIGKWHAARQKLKRGRKK